MSDPTEPIHQRLAALADPGPGDLVVDLGCGTGPTIAALAEATPQACFVGVDRSEAALRTASRLLCEHGASAAWVVADLRRPLPFQDSSVDTVVSYNTLECVLEPAALLDDVARVLRPGGRLLLAHVDFDTLTIAGAETVLDRAVCHAYADLAQPWMDVANGRIGRQLPGLVNASPLELIATEAHLTWSTELAGHAARRVDEIARALRSARGQDAITPADVARWCGQITESAVVGRFFYGETTLITTAERP